MRFHLRRLLIPALVAAIAPPVFGQSLADRIDAVRRQRAEAEQRARQQANTEANARLRMLQELFYTELTVEFDQTPARDVLNYLDDALELNLTARYSDDVVGHGIDPETEITLAATDMPAIEILEQVLEQCSMLESCTWQVRKSFIEVGTKERLSASSAQFVRMYPVSDLLFEPPDFDDAPRLDLHYVYEHSYGGFRPGYYGGYGGGYGGAGGAGGSITPSPAQPQRTTTDQARELVDLIVMTIEPDAWTQLGGTWASIQYLEGVLVVRAPEFIHRQLAGYPPIPPPPAAEPERNDSPANSAPPAGGSGGS